MGKASFPFRCILQVRHQNNPDFEISIAFFSADALKWVQQSQPALKADFKRLCSLASCRRCESGSKQTAASASWALRGLSAEDFLDDGLSGELFSFIQRCARLYLADVQLLLLAATG